MFHALALVALFPPAPLPVEAEPVPITSTPPQIVQARLVDGKLQTTVTDMVPRTVVQTVEENRNGRVIRRNIAQTVYTPVTRQMTHDPKDVTVYDLAGKKLELKDLEKRLDKWTLVALSGDDKPLLAGYAKLFRSGTLVVVLHRKPGPGPAASTVPPRAPE